ncbi:MAG: AsmA-like C-terminal region-containing protein, partial [Bacteroidota bacterium]
SPRTNIGARGLNLKASFTYLDGVKGGVQSFAIEELTGLFRRQEFKMALRVEDVADPRITFSANGALPLGTLPAILGEGPITDCDGFLRIENLELSGRYEDMLRARTMGRVAAAGRLTFDDGELTVNDRELSFPSGTLELRQNELELIDLAFSGPGTEIAFTGRATNLIPVLFADSLNTNDAELNFDARLTGESIDLDELLNLAGPTEEEEEVAAAAGQTDSLRAKTMTRRTQITDLLRGRFDASVDAWNYGEIEGEDFRGQLTFTPRRLDVVGLTAAMDGSLNLDGSVFFEAYQRVEGRISCDGVDVEQFFAQSENFGQEVLTNDNIEGEMDAKLFIRAYYDEFGEFDYDKLVVKAGISILNGELNDFKMLENFAFALKAGDLERVRFTKLQNYFEIEQQTLYIPLMFIQSSALNLEISGNHTFNNFLDYYIKVNAGQAIANKIKKHDDELEVLPARRRGFFNLYYTVYGPLDNYEVDSNKRAVKDDFRRSLTRKGRVKRDLEAAFKERIELVEDLPEEEDG